MRAAVSLNTCYDDESDARETSLKEGHLCDDN